MKRNNTCCGTPRMAKSPAKVTLLFQLAKPNNGVIQNILYFLHSAVTGMVRDDLVTQTGTVDMGIDFGSSYALVPQHGLYHAQVGTALEQVCGKGVAKGVRADIFLYPDRQHKLFYEVEYHDARKGLFQSLADEDEILVPGFDGYAVAVAEIGLELSYRTPRYGDKALFVALAGDTDELLGKVEVGHTQGAELRHT